MARNETGRLLTTVTAAVLAWVIPGAGHVFLKRTLRGVILCICVNGLFWSGVAFGGTFTVEPLRERWWFVAQMLAGASGGAGWLMQHRARDRVTKSLHLPYDPEDHSSSDLWWESYSNELAKRKLALTYPADTVARAYTGVAGMLNLMCVIDAALLAAMGTLGEPPPEGERRSRPHE